MVRRTRVPAAEMRVAFGTDERTPLTDAIGQALQDAGHDVVLRLEDEP